MVMMGDLLAAARDSAGRFQPWLQSTDPGLARDVATAAEREGLTPSGFVRVAVADFSRLASEEDWATLVSSIRDNPDPGAICLQAMVHWRLTARACSEHSHARKGDGAGDERYQP